MMTITRTKIYKIKKNSIKIKISTEIKTKTRIKIKIKIINKIDQRTKKMMLHINKKMITKIIVKKMLMTMMMMMIIIYPIRKKVDKIIKKMEIARTNVIRMIFMTVIPIKKIQYLIKKNLIINFLIHMVMDFGLDIYPHIHQEW